jgi:DNA-binding transcriptional regulator YiaG
MSKNHDTKDLEQYLEAHASDLVETGDDLDEFVRSAKKDNDERRARATHLQKLRRDILKLSQSELAKAVGANVRTLQGWETGRQDYPKSVEILMMLMKQVPRIKGMLIETRPPKKGRVTLAAPRKEPIRPKNTRRRQATKKSA